MPWLLFIVAAAWIVIGVAGNKKKQQAREEAEKRAAQQQAGAGAPAKVQPPPRPNTPFSPYFTDAPDAPRAPQRPIPVSPAACVPIVTEGSVTRMQEGPKSTLTEIQHTQCHTLTPRSKGTHAHEETSMTGIDAACPPEVAVVKKAVASPQPAVTYPGAPAFSWRPDAVLNGIVYAEILDKPKALRR